jgi:hypothetical protein
LVIVLGLAIWFLLKGLDVARQVYISSQQPPPRVAARETSVPNSETGRTTPDLQTGSAVPAADPSESAPPTADPPQPTDPLAALKLQAVFYKPDNPTAVINSKAVGIGSRIGDATVLSISSETVVVELGGRIRELTVP